MIMTQYGELHLPNDEDIMYIQDEKITRKDKQKILHLYIADHPAGIKVEIPVYILRGSKKGPVILIVSGLHGDEINGIEISREFLEKVKKIEKGTLIVIPVLNIYGFLFFSREVRDGKDINRLFPGSPTGSLSSRIAHFFYNKIFPLASAIIDLHSGGFERKNIPHIRCNFQDKNSLIFASLFGLKTVVNADYIPGSIRWLAKQHNIPCIVYEGGEALRLSKKAVKAGLTGLIRVLESFGMIKSHNSTPSQEKIEYFEKSKWLRSNVSGIFISNVQLGSYVRKNATLGKIVQLANQSIHEIKSSTDGLIIGINTNPMVFGGDALYHIAYNKVSPTF